MRTFALAASLAFSGTSFGAALQELDAAGIARLQKMVDQAASASGAIGAQVSIIRGNQRADFVHGSANVELGEPMTVDTIVQIGSVTKVINAAMIMTLVGEGKLSLDVPVVNYIPEFNLSDKQAQAAMTLRYLLSMRSGMDNGPYTDFGGDKETLGRYVASLKDVPQIFAPGESFGYSNAGISVGGFIAEKVTGIRWDTLVQQRIFEPAGIRHAVTLTEDLPFHRVSVGHRPAREGQLAQVVQPWLHTRSQGPSGSTLAMNAHELASFGRLFVNGGKAENGRSVLSEASLKAMMTAQTDVPSEMPYTTIGEKWGIGPAMRHWGDVAVWGHLGGTGCGVAQLVWFKEQRGVLAVTMNTPAALNAFLAPIFSGFSQTVFGVSAPPPATPRADVQVNNPARFIGTYLRVGTRYEIRRDGKALRLEEITLAQDASGKETAVEGELRRVRDDVFLFDVPGRTDKGVVAFSGKDSAGRATRLVAPVFAARRVQE